MKNLLIITCLLLLSYSSYAQKLEVEKRVTDHSVYVKGSGFEGVIFDEDYQDTMWGGFNKVKRFTPNGADIIKAEAILKSQLPDTAKKHKQKFIQKNVKGYLRQYIGIVGDKKEKVIYISFLWKKSIEENEELLKIAPNAVKPWMESWQTVFDGGYHYWQVEINLDTNELLDFAVNGSA